VTSPSEAILGIDLGGTKVGVGKVRGSELEAHHVQGISAREKETRVLEQIFQACDRVFDSEVAGIGCGVPSLVDVEQGIVHAVVNIPSWRKVHLKDELENRYGVPAFINNDANTFALGELYFGKGQGYRDMVGLTLGTGLGAGVIIDGHLYSGSNCGAGEIGEVPRGEQNIEYYCSGQFFLREAGMSGETVYRRAQEGDRQALELFENFGLELGYAIMTVLYAYDPELIVLGGSISSAFDLFEGGMRERLKEYAYQHALERLVISRSESENVAVLGAAALYLDATDRRNTETS
jgi:glucokinase